jgi:hypothetical protein
VHYNTDAIVRNTRCCTPPPRYFILDTQEQSFYRRTELPVPLIKERWATYRSPKSDRTARDKLPSREQNDKSPELARNILQGRRDLAVAMESVPLMLLGILVIIYSTIITVNQACCQHRFTAVSLGGDSQSLRNPHEIIKCVHQLRPCMLHLPSSRWIHIYVIARKRD